MRARIWLPLVAAVALAAGVAGYALFEHSQSAPARLRGSRPASLLAAQRTFSQRAAIIAHDLTSGSGAEVRMAVAMPADVELAPSAVRSLAALRDLTFLIGTFRPQSPSVATVQALVTGTGGARRSWAVTLIRSDSGPWKLALSTSSGAS